jgi:hypothetical protein
MTQDDFKTYAKGGKRIVDISVPMSVYLYKYDEVEKRIKAAFRMNPDEINIKIQLHFNNEDGKDMSEC